MAESREVQRWKPVPPDPVSSMKQDADGNWVRYADYAEVTAERDALLAEAIVSERQVVLEARLARVTAERDLLFDEGARKGQALAEVTAERDRLKDYEERGVRDYLDLQDISDRNQRHLDQLLDAVEAFQQAPGWDLVFPPATAAWEHVSSLVAKIREERS